MLEIANAAIEAIKCGTGLSASKAQKKKAKIGATLFSVYSNLNQLLIDGYNIIESLERIVLKNKSNDDSALLLLQHDLQLKLEEQSINIQRFSFSLRDLILELNIVDGGFVRDVQPLLSWEGSSFVGDLKLILDNNIVPFPEVPAHQISNLTASQLISLVDVREYGRRAKYSLCNSDLFYFLEKYEYRRFVADEEQKKIRKENERFCDEIKDYLETNDPRKVLHEIEIILESYRESLEKNFAISDILVEVGYVKKRAQALL
jgi:hypothetical protein